MRSWRPDFGPGATSIVAFDSCSVRRMCGRFTQHFTWRELHDLLGLVGAPRNLEPRYNVSPTSQIEVVWPGTDGLALVPMRWGLIPGWWKKSRREVPSTFNARCETVAEKPMFRGAFRRQRCVIPASGFYEWETTPAGKLPWYFTPAAGPVLLIAALWERWRDIEAGEDLLSATMIVTAANRFVSDLHDRMPVVLSADTARAWMRGDVGADVLVPAGESVLVRRRVSTRVNASRATDCAELIEPC